METIAIVMITFNEEHHIGQAIDNIKDFANEIYVLDSLSTDRTVDIALEKGAVVLQRPFTNFGDQWNFALQHFPIQSTWTIKMDPDERISEEAKRNILEAINDKNSVDCFSSRLRLWFMGKPLRSIITVLRGWRTGTCEFRSEINEKPVIEGKHRVLSGVWEHLDSPTLFDWQAKQNRYSTMEAIELYKHRQPSPPHKRSWSKYDVFSIPGCFFLIYCYHLFFKGAILDGTIGWAWAKLRTDVYRMQWYKYLEFVNKGDYTPLPVQKRGEYHSQVLGTALQQKIMAI